MIAAVVPVKSLATSKSRLLPRLGPDGARRLSIAMLGDVLEALLAVEAISRVAVVTPDSDVAEAARAAGAEALVRRDLGLNPSIEVAAAELAPGPDDGVLVVLGDVAGARPEDLRRLLAAAPARGAVLAPSSDGGTAALLRRPKDVFPAAFGPDSAKRHREQAERGGVSLAELRLDSLALDLDSPEDLASFLAGSGAGRRTRALLAELGVAAG
jgi:2-phospho-L-lactate guanylyltransferase